MKDIMALIGQILLGLLNVAFNVIGLALTLRILLPFLKVRSDYWLMRGVFVITEPFLKPVRRYVHRSMGWMTPQGYVDFTPLVAFFILWLLRGLLAFFFRLMIVPPLWLFNPLKNPGLWLTNLINMVFDLYIYAIFLRVLLDLIGTPLSNTLMNFLYNLTEPLMAPIRRRIPPFGAFDFTPLFAVIVVVVVQTLVSVIVQILF